MPPAKPSPLMEQYYQNKKLYPDALLLFRVGDFYETFADDAVIVARDLNITLTSRQKDDQGEKIPLAGVPYHSLDAYLARTAAIHAKLELLQQLADDHFGHDPEHIHWGHVGDLTRIENGLREVLALLDGSDE